jgi:hypothetical protein
MSLEKHLTMKGSKEMRTGFWSGNSTERKKERKRVLGRSRFGRKDNIKMVLQGIE